MATRSGAFFSCFVHLGQDGTNKNLVQPGGVREHQIANIAVLAQIRAQFFGTAKGQCSLEFEQIFLGDIGEQIVLHAKHGFARCAFGVVALRAKGTGKAV